MSRIECQYESEILDAVASGRWPDRADAELKAHHATCSICSEVALISAIYRDDYATALEEAKLPSAGLVWWKSELRARQEAVRVASRPITWIQGIAGVCAVGVMIAVIVGVSRYLGLEAISAFLLGQPVTLWLLLGAIAGLTPVALYFVYSDE